MIKNKLIIPILATAVAFNSLAGPIELNDQITDLKNGAKKGYNRFVEYTSGKREFKAKEGYTTEISATHAIRQENTNAVYRTTNVTISDNTTIVSLTDKGSDGINEGDSLVLSHNYLKERNLKVFLDYKKDHNFSISAHMSQDGTNISNLYVNSEDLNKVTRFLVEGKIETMLNFGTNLYGKVVSSAEKGTNMNIPYQDLKTALNKTQDIANKVTSSNYGLSDILISIGKSGLKAAKKEIKD